MQLTPRYGTEPIIVLDGPPGAIARPAIRQRQRLVEVLGTFSDEQWAHPSRCAGWSNQAVITHLDSTNTFWSFSISMGQAGSPSTFLATFDPVATPAQLVADAGALSAAEVYDRFARSTAALVEAWESLDDADWSALAESPPGHVTISALAHHALWDSWVHERDILLPLGVTPEQHADEVEASLRYAAALSPAFAIDQGSAGVGTLSVEATDPDVSLVVEVGGCATVRSGAAAADLCLTGDAVELLEALSVRRPLAQDVPAESAWMVEGLAVVFDQPA